MSLAKQFEDKMDSEVPGATILYGKFSEKVLEALHRLEKLED